MNADLVIRSQRVVTPESVAPASIHILDGRILAVAALNDFPAGAPVFDAGNSVVMPGLVDTHVHINEPGRTDWEGFASATRAAAAGGVTMLLDMPLNSIPATTTAQALGEKRAAAQGKCFVDVGFWGGVVPGNVEQLQPLFEADVLGFKCFLIPSGVEEFPHVSESDLRIACKELKRLDAVLIVHAELPGPVDQTGQELDKNPQDPRRYSTFLKSRPRKAEDQAVALVIRLCRETGCRMHIVHLSSSGSLPALRAARGEGLPITAETCPHYLCLAAKDVPDGATEFKCCPPVRERENNAALWAALGEGIIEMVVSDHSPCPPEMKLRDSGDFLRAWGGVSSLQLRLPLIWTAARRRGFSFLHLTDWLCHAPARLVGLHHRKGAIQKGYDADLVVWNPEASFTVDGATLHHRHKLTPYAGKTMEGAVEATFLRGRKIFERGQFAPEAAGEIVSRETF